jgi:phytoene synthase
MRRREPAGTLDRAYRECRAIHRTHGRSYYLATRLLPAWKRRHVHALYAFTRWTDDLVDRPGEPGAPGHTGAARRLAAWSARFYASLDGEAAAETAETATGVAEPGDPVLLAVRHTIAVFGLERGDFDAFFASMETDLTTGDYADYDTLLKYMEGSAAVIGTLMLPILLAPERGGRPGPSGAARDAASGAAREASGAARGAAPGPAPAARVDVREAARQLGLAFQLTNFIRDVAEDLRLGRVYLPAADLDRFGVRRADLAARSANPAVRRLIAFEIERAREHYRNAAPGVAVLPARSRRCVRLAFAVYGAILDRVERAGHDVLAGRAVVPRRQRMAAVVRELARAA